MSNKLNKLTTKRFVIRQSLIGKNTVITFVNKKGVSITYDHDEVYTRNKERFDSMNCFIKYKSYTNSNNIPTFCRDTEVEDDSPNIETVFTMESNGYVQSIDRSTCMTISHDIMSCQVVMTKRHGGISVNYFYQLNKVYTFTI